MSQTLLVTGAAGHLGRLVVENLLAAKAGHVVAATRDPAKLADLAARGVEVRKVDFDDPASLATGFAGIDRMLLISTDALGTDGRRLAQHKAAVAAAAAAGVKHIVYTSMLQPEPGSPIVFAPDHYGTEQAVKSSGLGWTILRNNWYFENLKMALPGILASGQWYSAAGAGKVSSLSRADCAAAAAAALATTSEGNATYEITGAEALTTEQQAALLSSALGKPITVVHVTDEQLVDGLKAHGLPPFMAAFVACFDTNTRLGRAAQVSNDVAHLTGRQPETLAAYLKENAAAWRG